MEQEKKQQTETRDSFGEYWTYPEGYEKVKELIDFLPEEEKDSYLQGLLMAFMDT